MGSSAEPATPAPTRRAAVPGRHGAVATGHPLATAAALRVLFEGGNAVDAAVAAGAVLGVVLPDMCGVGGDAFALVFDPRVNCVTALNGSGRCPADPGDLLRERPSEYAGPALATVPGAIQAWSDLLERFGTRSLQSVMSPAIEYALDGFPIGPRLERQVARFQDVLLRHPTSASVFMPDGQLPEQGQLFRQKDLADTLQHVAEAGPAVFYAGEIATRMTAWCEQHGGMLTPHDFNHTSTWAEPLVGNYSGLDIYVSPPVSQAFLLLVQAAILSYDDLATLGHNSAPTVHLMVEAKKRAFALRDDYLGDPEFVDALPTALSSREFARSLRTSISPSSASPANPVCAGGERNNTTYLAVVDRNGMGVSLIQSIYSDWGCGAIAGDTGVLLNDRLLGFSWNPRSPNVIAPSKRPVHTLSPCMILHDGRLRIVIGTPGADAQVQTLIQTLVNLFDHGMGLQEAIEAPRWRSGDDGELLLERRWDAGTAAELMALGHRVQLGDEWDTRTGGVQAIMADPRNGSLLAAADPRRDGLAIGY